MLLGTFTAAVGFLIAGAGHPVGVGATEDPGATSAPSITTYVVAVDVSPDGALQITETITFSPGTVDPSTLLQPRWRTPGDAETTAAVDVRIRSLTDDSAGATFELTYQVPDGVRAFTEGDLEQANPLGFAIGDAELYAEVIGPREGTEIAEARIMVRPPTPVLAAACFVDNRSAPVCNDRIADDEVTFRAVGVPAEATVSIAVVISGAGLSLPPPQPRDTGAFPGDVGWWLIAIAALVGLGFLALAIAIVRRRRQRRA
jgi:hypothetical protein